MHLEDIMIGFGDQIGVLCFTFDCHWQAEFIVMGIVVAMMWR